MVRWGYMASFKGWMRDGLAASFGAYVHLFVEKLALGLMAFTICLPNYYLLDLFSHDFVHIRHY